MTHSVFHQAQVCLRSSSPEEKVMLTRQFAKDWTEGKYVCDHDFDLTAQVEAGRPDKPELVQAKKLAKRSISTPEGRVILAHALAHIEFNAINLALDAAYRFRNMPELYYANWIKVADEEAYHFTLLNKYLQDRGHSYGDFPAHNGLWEMAQKTAHDVMIRMALVPRVLEARGLDVTPGLISKLKQFSDQDFIDVLEIIHRDEIGHVYIGSHWFKYICEQRQLDSRQTFKSLIEQYMNGSLRGPFDEAVRLEAGFSKQEIADLYAMEP